MSRLLLCLCLALTAAPLWAQPSGAEILQTAIDRYAERMADVENYTVTQTMSLMDMEMMTYYERDPDGGPLDYTSTTYVNGRASADQAQTSSDPYAALSCLKSRAEYAGTETVDGTTTYAVRINDFGECADEMGGVPGEDGQGTLESGTMYVDTDDYLLRRMIMEGTMRMNGQSSDYTATADLSDYRTVEGMMHPFTTEMTMSGMGAMMGEGDNAEMRQQLQELRAQMDEMPESMRGMLEDQIERLESSMGEDGMTFSITVTDLAVNEGPPQN